MPAAPLLNHAIESFSTWLRVERNLAPRTREAYVYELMRFSEWLSAKLESDKVKLTTISNEQLRNYAAYAREQLGYKATTMNRVVSAIRVFFKFCVDEHLIEANPAQDLERPKLPKRLPVYLIRDELRRLFEAPDQSTVLGMRDFAILVTLGYTGIRLQELVRLNTLDIDFARDTIRVFGKGRKERLVPMNESVRETLRCYLEHSERTPAQGERAVFLNARGKRLTGRAVQYMVDRYVREAGISKEGVSPHKLRHTFATLLYSRDIDLVDIQSLMGHASLTSTQIYTHTDTSRLQATIERLEFEE